MEKTHRRHEQRLSPSWLKETGAHTRAEAPVQQQARPLLPTDPWEHPRKARPTAKWEGAGMAKYWVLLGGELS